MKYNNEIINQLKHKFKNAKNSERLQILIVLPKSRPILKIVKEFKALQHAVRTAKNLLKLKGIQLNPDYLKPGRFLFLDIVEEIKQFFNARKKDFISISTDNGKIHTQKS